MPLTDTVTVVLLTYNCESRLSFVLDRLTSLSEQPAIIAVDNGSTDGTADLLKRYPLTTIALPENLGAPARNIGARAASTPYIAFSDDDTCWEDGALTRAVEHFEKHPPLTLINARVLVGPSDREDPLCQEMADSPLDGGTLPGHKLLSYLGGACIVRRDAFLAAGGYDPRLFMGGEEELLAAGLVEAGGELRYIPEIVTHHYPSQANADTLRWYGARNALWFVWRRRSIKNACRWTSHVLRTAGPRIALKAATSFLLSLPWVIRTRVPVPPEMEHELELLDAQRFGNNTRCYG